MKKIFLIAAIVCSALMVLQSCSPKGAASTTTQSLKKGGITGNWVLNDITFDGVPQSAVKSLFGESSYKCFIGSSWRLTASYNGTYTLPGGTGCDAKTQNIYWGADTKSETFQFKKINAGEKPKNVTDGYRMLLSSADGQSMVIRTPVEYGNSPAYIVLNFTKAAK